MAAAPTERVTRRAADGKVYTRVLKRQQTTDETWRIAGVSLYHWCANESPELLTAETPAHVCDIWRVADDQAEPEAEAIAPPEITTDDLIRRVLFTEEQLTTEPVPLLARVAVLALLKQAKALEDILVLLEDWKRHRQKPRRLTVQFSPPPAESSPDEQG